MGGPDRLTVSVIAPDEPTARDIACQEVQDYWGELCPTAAVAIVAREEAPGTRVARSVGIE